MADFTADDLSAINAAIKSGELSVRIGDQQVTYRSLDEMLKVRSLIRQDLGLSANSSYRYAGTRRGL